MKIFTKVILHSGACNQPGGSSSRQKDTSDQPPKNQSAKKESWQAGRHDRELFQAGLRDV